MLLRLTPFIEIVQNLLHKMSWLRNESRINQAELGRFLLGLGTWASNKASHGKKNKKKIKKSTDLASARCTNCTNLQAVSSGYLCF